ncbi:MAG: ABC transporter ATP-binding protein [Desulfobacterales bacterium]|nr:ABC transporter ATP-binding protein [Desulfobacterales bacterium]
MGKTILDVVNLKKHFLQRRGLFSALRAQERIIPAVDDVSFYLKEHETLGLVGESGSGKTTVGKTILRLTPATSGRISFAGKDITALSAREFRPLRKEMQMIFQDLDAALNPKMRIRAILKEAISVHQDINGAQVDRKMDELLEQVNLKESKLTNFPHELSGGEKRRVGIARALAVGARFLVADEPTSALDVSIQAQVVNLLKDLQKNLGLSYLFISHDLRIVELVSHKVAVMYLGKIVEMGLVNRIAEAPRHPYTHILWSSLVDKESREASGTSSEAPSADWGVFDFERPYHGCRFAPRCPVHQARGRPERCINPSTEPQLHDIAEAHKVACHFPL